MGKPPIVSPSHSGCRVYTCLWLKILIPQVINKKKIKNLSLSKKVYIYIFIYANCTSITLNNFSNFFYKFNCSSFPHALLCWIKWLVYSFFYLLCCCIILKLRSCPSVCISIWMDICFCVYKEHMWSSIRNMVQWSKSFHYFRSTLKSSVQKYLSNGEPFSHPFLIKYMHDYCVLKTTTIMLLNVWSQICIHLLY